MHTRLLLPLVSASLLAARRRGRRRRVLGGARDGGGERYGNGARMAGVGVDFHAAHEGSVQTGRGRGGRRPGNGEFVLAMI